MLCVKNMINALGLATFYDDIIMTSWIFYTSYDGYLGMAQYALLAETAMHEYYYSRHISNNSSKINHKWHTREEATIIIQSGQ